MSSASAVSRRADRFDRYPLGTGLSIPATISLAFALFALLGLGPPVLMPTSTSMLGRAMGQIAVIDTDIAGSWDRAGLAAARDDAPASPRPDPVAALPATSSVPAEAAPQPHEVALPVPDQEQSGAEPAAAASETAPARREATRYTVRLGDTLSRVAAQFGVDAGTIAAANGLASADRIQVGQRLLIPGSDDSIVATRARTAADITSSRSSQESFIAALAPAAQGSQRATGVPSSVTLAQAILETYWGTSYLAREANNYFGIKAYARPGSAGVVVIDAWEVENGRNVTRQEPFRKYTDPLESFTDHGRFFLENPRYASALQATDDPREFARRINAAGYATDPAYANKLISYMDRYNLYQYDLAPAR